MTMPITIDLISDTATKPTEGIRVGAVSDYVLRAVTHLDITTQNIDHVVAAFSDCR
jgi:threonine aldolase